MASIQQRVLEAWAAASMKKQILRWRLARLTQCSEATCLSKTIQAWTSGARSRSNHRRRISMQTSRASTRLLRAHLHALVGSVRRSASLRRSLRNHLYLAQVRRQRAVLTQWMAVMLRAAMAIVHVVLIVRHRRLCCRFVFRCWHEEVASPLRLEQPVCKGSGEQTVLSTQLSPFFTWRMLCQQRYRRWESVQRCRLRAYVKIVRKAVKIWQMQAHRRGTSCHR